LAFADSCRFWVVHIRGTKGWIKVDELHLEGYKDDQLQKDV